MKYIPLLAVLLLAGCAAPLAELKAEAKECTATSINPQGVIGKPTDEQSTACWAEFNKRLEAHARWEERQVQKQGGKCPDRLIAWCDSWGRCRCVSQSVVREELRRVGLSR